MQDYRDIIQRAISHLSVDSLPIAVEIAAVPEQIRGYGQRKEQSMIAARKSWDWLIRGVDNPGLRGTDPVRIVDPAVAC